MFESGYGKKNQTAFLVPAGPLLLTTENKPKLTYYNFKSELITSDSWINDSLFICDLICYLTVK